MASPTTVPMIDPNGNLGDVPQEQMKDALNGGGKLAIPMIGPDGSKSYVPHDQVEPARKAGAKVDTQASETPSLMDTIKKSFGIDNLAKNVSQGLKELVPSFKANPLGPLAAPVSMGASAIGQAEKAKADFGKGDVKGVVSGAGHATAAALPLVGPYAANLGEQAGGGDVGGAAARGGAQALVGEAVRVLPKVVSKAADTAKAVAPGYLKSADELAGTTPERIGELKTVPQKMAAVHKLAVDTESSAKAAAKAAYPKIETPIIRARVVNPEDVPSPHENPAQIPDNERASNEPYAKHIAQSTTAGAGQKQAAVDYLNTLDNKTAPPKSGTYYHVAPEARVPQLLSEGLHPNPGSSHVFVTSGKNAASIKAVMEANRKVPHSILEVDVNGKNLRPDPMMIEPGSFSHRGPINPEHIRPIGVSKTAPRVITEKIPFEKVQEERAAIGQELANEKRNVARGAPAYELKSLTAKYGQLSDEMREAAQADGKLKAFQAAEVKWKQFQNDFHNPGSAVQPLLKMQPDQTSAIANHILNNDKGARTLQTLRKYGADTGGVEKVLSRGSTPLKVDVTEASKLQKAGSDSNYRAQRFNEALDQATTNRLPSGTEAKLPAAAMKSKAPGIFDEIPGADTLSPRNVTRFKLNRAVKKTLSGEK